jgi:hypothetical protein
VAVTAAEWPLVIASVADGRRKMHADEDGAVQTYTIKNYEDLSHQGTRTMPDGMYVTDRTFVYECQVQAFGRYRMIRL